MPLVQLGGSSPEAELTAAPATQPLPILHPVRAGRLGNTLVHLSFAHCISLITKACQVCLQGLT